MALVATLTTIAEHVGANRIVAGAGVPHVIGNPSLDPVAERALRRKLVERALETLTIPLKEQRVF